MSRISLIAAMDESRGLGSNNKLLCHLPADLHYFKATTLNKPIIMGRTTFDAIGRPLPDRDNIVLSQSVSIIEGVKVFDSLEKALIHTNNALEVMIIGGAQLYAQSIDIAHCLYITKIHHHFAADVFFPEIDKNIWFCSKKEFRKRDAHNSYDMSF